MFRVSTTTRQSRRSLAALAGACIVMSAAVAGPAAAYAPKIGDTPADFGKPATVHTAKVGDTPADFPKATQVQVHAPKVGDTPAEFGKPTATPSLVEIVRPERTIVRDTDPALPIVMSAVALLLGLGLALQSVMQGHAVRTRAH